MDNISIKSRVIKTELIKWQELQFLQEDSFKDLSSGAKEKLKQSVLSNDFSQPFYVWNDEKNAILYCLDGKHRYQVLKELLTQGTAIPTELPATFMACDSKQDAAKLVLQYSSTFAKISEKGLLDFIESFELNFDEMKMVVDLPEVDLLNFERSFLSENVIDDDFEVVVNDIKTDIVLGDLFEIGEHKLLCGDATLASEYRKVFNSQVADLVLCDPPYNVNYQGKTKQKLTIENDMQNDSDFYKFLYDLYSAQASFAKKGGAWYVWHADLEGANFRSAMVDAGIMLKQCLIWVKSGMVMGRQDYHWKHEPCLYGWKEGAAHAWFADRKQTTVLNFDKPQKNEEHPTMKPVALFAYQIGNSSKQGDIVSDPFLGSGTTMIASHQLKRKCYGMELDPRYCQVIIDRMRNLDPTLLIKKNGKVYIP